MNKNKNHFIFSYCGNKRSEVDYIFNNVDFKNIDTIIEPFCGSSAVSYFLSLKYPKKFKYVLNDTDKYLIELYNILLDEKKTLDFEENINKICSDDLTKEKYLNIENPLYKYYIHKKIHQIRPGLYPVNYKYKYINVNNCPIVNFLRTENILIFEKDGLEIYKEYNNNKNNLIFLDPPYLLSENSWYNFDKDIPMNIYEYISKNDTKKLKSTILFILAKNWIIDLIFNKYHMISYEKNYCNNNKKGAGVIHLLISNKKFYDNISL